MPVIFLFSPSVRKKWYVYVQPEENKAMAILNEKVSGTTIKSKAVNKTGTELTLEVRLKSDSTVFLHRLNDLAGIRNATLISYNGEYMS